eukprot:285085_1
MTAKFLFIKNKMVNDEKRIKFNIRADLDSIEHFIIKIASKFDSFRFEEAQDADEEPEEPRNGINGQINGINDNDDDNDDESVENAYKLEDLNITYSLISDGRHLVIKNDEEFEEVIESHCEVAAKEFVIKEFIIEKAGSVKLVKALPDKAVAALEAQVLKLAIRRDINITSSRMYQLFDRPP